MRPASVNNLGDIKAALDEIQRASQEGDTVDIASPYVITGTFTETRALNLTTPTAANIAAVLATLIQDLKRGGNSRTT